MADDEEDDMWWDKLSQNSQGTQDGNFRTNSNFRSTLEKLISQAQESDTPKTNISNKRRILKRNASECLSESPSDSELSTASERLPKRRYYK